MGDEGYAISSVHVNATKFVLKLKTLRCGPVLYLKSKNFCGHAQQMIFLDEEGTKIQTTIPNIFSGLWNIVTNFSKVYYVMNGRIRTPFKSKINVNYSKEIEITELTKINECKTAFNTSKFSKGFSKLDITDDMNTESDYDIIGILVEAHPLKTKHGLNWRKIEIADESNERTTVTLWDEQATHDGLLFDNARKLKSIVAFCNVKVNDYRGSVGFKSDKVTSVLIDENFERANELVRWSRIWVERNIDITFEPSQQFRKAAEMNLIQMLDPCYDNPLNLFTKFTATITEILLKDDILYAFCVRCNELPHLATRTTQYEQCVNCRRRITYRYYVRLVLLIHDNPVHKDKTNNEATSTATELREVNEQNTIIVLMFTGAKFLTGCNPDKYHLAMVNKGRLSEYYKRMVAAEGKKYSFMVRDYQKFTQTERITKILIEEMHQVENEWKIHSQQGNKAETSRQKRESDNDIEKNERWKTTSKMIKNQTYKMLR